MGYWEEMRLRLMELEEELEASGIEDATEWEKFPEMERIMYDIAEHDMRLAEYPREQYEQDRAKLIADGVDPRLIMSYSACIAYDEMEAELEREREIEEAYDEWQRECAITAEVAERDEIIELAEMAWEAAMVELAAFGTFDEYEPYYECLLYEDDESALAFCSSIDERREEFGAWM